MKKTVGVILRSDGTLDVPVQIAKSDLDDLVSKLRQAGSRIAVLEDALRTYADPANWIEDFVDVGVGGIPIPGTSIVDTMAGKWELARRALGLDIDTGNDT